MEDECYPCMPPGSLPVTNNTVVKEEPLSPVTVEDDPANHLLSELQFAPNVVKDEPNLEPTPNFKAPTLHVLPPSSKASIPVFGHANRVVFPKVNIDSRKK